MKHFYSFILFALFLLIGTSCKDDDREIVFFSGDAPVYDVGGGGNLIASVSLYTLDSESKMVGIDGGDGEYIVLNSDETVATAELVGATAGYSHLKLTHKKTGETLVTVKDGNGKTAMLKVMVSVFKYTWPVTEVRITINGTVTAEKKAEIEASFKDTYPVPVGGHYDLYPDSWENATRQGRLVVYSDDTNVAPLEGRYEVKSAMFEGKEVAGYYFTYNEQEHLYFNTLSLPVTRNLGPAYYYLVEDVTAECTVELPEGVKIYRGQRVQVR